MLLLLSDLSLNDSGSRGAQRITLSIRLSPTNADSKLNEVKVKERKKTPKTNHTLKVTSSKMKKALGNKRVFTKTILTYGKDVCSLLLHAYSRLLAAYLDSC